MSKPKFKVGPAKTRDGREAVIHTVDGPDRTFKMIASIKWDSTWKPCQRRLDGSSEFSNGTALLDILPPDALAALRDAVEALGFYGDKDNWMPGADDSCEDALVCADFQGGRTAGERARKALARLEPVLSKYQEGKDGTR